MDLRFLQVIVHLNRKEFGNNWQVQTGTDLNESQNALIQTIDALQIQNKTENCCFMTALKYFFSVEII